MELKAYLTPLIKWWWLLLASAGVAAASSGFAVFQQPNIYEARATLLIGSAINNPNPTGNEFWLSQQLAQTYTNLAQREVVRLAVMERIGLTWLPEYTVSSVPNTQLMEVAVRDTSPERAMVIANELAAELIAQAPTSEQAGRERTTFIENQLDELESRIQETDAEILERQTELAGLFSARQIADTQSQIAALETKKTTLQSNYASLLASSAKGAANTLSLIEPASVPTVAVGPERLMTIITAAAIGLSLAIGAAYLLEYLDDTLKTPSDVARSTDLPTLAGIAEFAAVESEGDDLLTLSDPRSPIAESYRALRTSLMFTSIDEPSQLILVTSANPGEGKSVTVANLGVVMAQAGLRVLIVDADLRRPTQHQLFGVPRENGLTTLFANQSIGDSDDTDRLSDGLISKMISATAQPGLFVLPSGLIPPNPAELLGSRKMQKLLQTMQVFFDVVLLDSPPVLAVTDAVILSTRADSTVLVAGAGTTRRNQLAHAVRQLREVRATPVGVVLNRLTSRSGDYYYYYYERGAYYGSDVDDWGAGVEAERGTAQSSLPVSGRRPRPGILSRLRG